MLLAVFMLGGAGILTIYDPTRPDSVTRSISRPKPTGWEQPAGDALRDFLDPRLRI